MSEPSQKKAEAESAQKSSRTSSKLSELDLTRLYDLIKGDRFAQAEVWTALEDFRSGDFQQCRVRLQVVFRRVGESLQETAKDTAEQRTKRIIDKMAADQGKSYKRVATPDLVARTKVRAEQQVEKARKIVTAFESVLNRLPSPASAHPVPAHPGPADSGAVQSGVAQSETTVKPSSATASPLRGEAAVRAESSVIVDPSSTADVGPGNAAVPADAFLAFKASRDARDAQHALSKFFELRKVDDPALIQPGVLFHLHGGVRGNLVRITSIEKANVQLEKPQSGQPYQDLVPLAYFVKTGSQGTTHRLELKQPSRVPTEAPGEDPAEDPANEFVERQAKPRGDEESSLLTGRQDAAVTRASFQLLISDIGRAKQKLQVFSDLHNVRVNLNIDTRAISDADRGSFRQGDRVKARQQAEIIKSQVSTAVNSARASIQKREQEFRQSKEKVAGSERRPMESCFAPTYLSLHAVEKAMRKLVQGLDAALSLDTEEAGQAG